MPHAPDRPPCVVLDTNQWDAHTMLRSHLAASLIYLIEQHGARLGVPEIVEIEVSDHASTTLRKAATAAEGALDRIRMLLGEAPDPGMPDESEAAAALPGRLFELEALVVSVPIEDRHHVAAGQMVLRGSAPNGPKGQQYKDCLLWQAVLDLSKEYDVLLVSGDNGFYADKEGNALHPDLADAPRIRLRRTLDDAVAHLQETVPALDLDPILEAVDVEIRPQVAAMGSVRGFEVEGINNAAADAFVTGQPGETLVVFEMTHDLIGDGPALARVITQGETLVRGGVVGDLRLGSMELEVYGDGGFGSAGRTVFAQVGSVLGGLRRRQHQLRVPSPGPAQSRL